jgi:hypothetical protein
MPTCPYKKTNESGEVYCDVMNHKIIPQTRYGVTTCMTCPDNYYAANLLNASPLLEEPKKRKPKKIKYLNK